LPVVRAWLPRPPRCGVPRSLPAVPTPVRRVEAETSTTKWTEWVVRPAGTPSGRRFDVGHDGASSSSGEQARSGPPRPRARPHHLALASPRWRVFGQLPPGSHAEKPTSMVPSLGRTPIRVKKHCRTRVIRVEVVRLAPRRIGLDGCGEVVPRELRMGTGQLFPMAPACTLAGRGPSCSRHAWQCRRHTRRHHSGRQLVRSRKRLWCSAQFSRARAPP